MGVDCSYLVLCRGLKMEYRKALGKAIKFARKGNGYTQESSSLSRTYMSDVESGKKDISVVKLNELANSIGIHPLTIYALSYLNLYPEMTIDELHSVVIKELSELNKPKNKNAPIFKKVKKTAGSETNH